MSYGNVRQRMVEAPQPQNTNKCEAYGCPCRGSISVEGSKFLCAGHAFIPADRWQAASTLFNDHIWLIEFVDEMKLMDGRHQDWRGFATQFWAKDDDAQLMQPDPKENAVPYQNRMRGELLYRAGLMKRPAIRLPRPVQPGGRFVGGSL